jgi:hypothetical protein
MWQIYTWNFSWRMRSYKYPTWMHSHIALEKCTLLDTWQFILCLLVERSVASTKKCTLVQALRFCTGRRSIWGVEIQLYSFMTKALEEGEGSVSHPGRSLPPGKTRYQFYRRLSGSQGRSGQVRKILPPPGFHPRTVQPVPNCYVPTTLLGPLRPQEVQ